MPQQPTVPNRGTETPPAGSSELAPQRVIPELKWLDGFADLLDNRFVIPFTNFRFGVDALIGLVPYAGDVLSFIVSGFLVVIMVRHGASGMLVVKMLSNILLDGMIGTVPFLGDLFDFRYKANMRNVSLLKQHYEQGLHQGSAWWVVLLIIGLVIALIALSVFVIWKVVYWVVS